MRACAIVCASLLIVARCVCLHIVCTRSFSHITFIINHDRLRAATGGSGGGRTKAAATGWPVKGEDLGGYARVPSDDSPMWELLLDGLRVCDEV